MANKINRSRNRPPWANPRPKPAPAPAKIPWWRKPIAWVVTLLLGALGVALTGWLEPQFTDAINEVTETGDPVTVHVEESPIPYPIALPSSVKLTENDLAQLSQLPVEDQRAHLKGLGGVRQGGMPITVTVTGDRANEVRITNIVPVVDCSAPDAGTLVWTEVGFGATQNSTEMHLIIDENVPTPYFVNENFEEIPFFPAKTIALKQDEQVVIVIRARAGELTCSFELEMTVLDGSNTHLQRITNQGEPFVRAPHLENEEFEQVYYGGNVCESYVEEQFYSNIGAC